jgi:putative tricarboxylic transport membrane protein
MTLALIMVSAVLGNSALRGLISLFAGLLFGLVGIDLQTGQARFTFGQPELLDGIEVTIAAVGLFAIGEALFLAWQGREGKNTEVLKVSGSLWLSKDDWKRSWKPWFRGAFFGFPIGAMPAGGAELPTLLSYYTEKKLAKNPEEFGHGAIEGVAGPEADIGNIILLILNLPLVGLWVKLLKIPPPWLYAGIIIISTAGVYGSSNSAFDVGLLFFFGLLGFVMRRFDFPAAPMIIGLILGPMAEQSMRQAMTISQGQWSTFFTRPISGSIMLIAIALLVVPPMIKLLKKKDLKT